MHYSLLILILFFKEPEVSLVGYAMKELVTLLLHRERNLYLTLGQSHQTMNCFEYDLNGDY